MPLDDLDDFLAMELGASAKPLKTSQQVNSLEAQVLSRVQETCPPEDRPSQLENKPIKKDPQKSTVDPIYELTDLLIPVINTLKMLLTNSEAQIDKDNLLTQRSKLADQLLALPEIDSIDKPGIFAAIASCMDAVSSTKAEKRFAAQIRLQTLSEALIAAKEQAQEEQSEAFNNFLQQFPNS